MDSLTNARRDLDTARRSLNSYLYAGNTPLSGRSARNDSKFSGKLGSSRHRKLSAAIAQAEARIVKLSSPKQEAAAA